MVAPHIFSVCEAGEGSSLEKKLELLKRFKGVALGALMNPGLQRMRIRRVAKGIVMGSAEFAFLANFFHSFVTAP